MTTDGRAYLFSFYSWSREFIGENGIERYSEGERRKQESLIQGFYLVANKFSKESTSSNVVNCLLKRVGRTFQVLDV